MAKRRLALSLTLLVAIGALWWIPTLADAGTHAHGVRELKGAGVSSWIAPSGVKDVTLELWGASGGGSRAASKTVSGSGGGGGAYVRSVVPVVPGASYTIVVGLAGAASGTNWGDPGGAGTDTQFRNAARSVIAYAGGGAGGSDVTGGGPGGVADPSAGIIRTGRPGTAGGGGLTGGSGGAAWLGSVEVPYPMNGGSGGPARTGTFHGAPGGDGYAIVSW
jgi:hypothetical protein